MAPPSYFSDPALAERQEKAPVGGTGFALPDFVMPFGVRARVKTTDTWAQTQDRLVEAIEEVDSLHHPDMIFVQDAKTRQFVLFNRAGEELLGWHRETFAAVVHDLRTPIQAILIYCEILQAESREGSGKSAITAIQRNAAQLKLLTSDLLDATRIELRTLPLKLASIDLPVAVSALVERIRPSLGRHPVTVDVTGQPPRARLDPLRFEQILTNVIENAARYFPETAPIRVRVAADGAGVSVSVSDLGPGIAPENLSRIFNRFYRARPGHGGLGLGLYISKERVEAHGGRMAVDSRPGEGSTFQIWFPADPEAAPVI